MTSESYRKWIIITLFLLVFGLVIFASTRSQYRTKKPVETNLGETPVSGPILDKRTEMEMLLEQSEKNLNDPEILASLGDLQFESKRFEEAIETYEKVVKLNPKDVDTYNDLGLALYYAGRSDAAIETLRKGTKVTPSYQRIWLSLGFVLAAVGKNEEAKPALTEAIGLNPESVVGQEAKRMLQLLR